MRLYHKMIYKYLVKKDKIVNLRKRNYFDFKNKKINIRIFRTWRKIEISLFQESANTLKN